MTDVTTKYLSEVLWPPISGGRPKGGVSTETEGVPSLGGENILSSGGVTYEVIKRIPKWFFDLMPKGRLRGGDVLINKDGAQTGKVGYYVGDLFEEAAVNEHLFILRGLNDDVIEQSYLYYSLLLPETQRKIERRITGSAQPGLNSSFVRAVDIPYHYIAIQKDISRILRTIDSAIEKTESLIAKYQKIKAGLMHDLFTRGVTADGKLRPPREQTPELYQETPIGWIPKEWRVEKLGRLSEIVSGVTLGAARSAMKGIAVPYLRVANVQDGYLDLSDIKTVNATLQELEKLRLKEGDVLMNEGGDFDKLGRGTVWHGEIQDCVHQNHVFRVRPTLNEIQSDYLAYWSQSSYGKKYFILSSKQSTNLASINSTQLNAFPIAVPSFVEQRNISGRIHAVISRIDLHSGELAKLNAIKLGLMRDLLTGRVRVEQ